MLWVFYENYPYKPLIKVCIGTRFYYWNSVFLSENGKDWHLLALGDLVPLCDCSHSYNGKSIIFSIKQMWDLFLPLNFTNTYESINT